MASYGNGIPRIRQRPFKVATSSWWFLSTQDEISHDLAMRPGKLPSAGGFVPQLGEH